MKKRHTSLFSGLCREIRTKLHQTFAEKIAKFEEEKRKIEAAVDLEWKRKKILQEAAVDIGSSLL